MARLKHKVRLAVRSADQDDVYKDIARIPQASRGNLKTGRLHRIIWKGESGYFILRGLEPRDGKVRKIDAESRERLGVTTQEPVDFTIQEASFWGELVWGWNATDPAYRVAAKLGVLGLVLGVLGLLAGIVGIGFGVIAHDPSLTLAL